MISLFSPELLVISLVATAVCIAFFAYLIKKIYATQHIIKMHSTMEIGIVLFGIWCLAGIALLRLTVEISIVPSIEFVFLFSFISNMIFVCVIILIGCIFLLNGEVGKILPDWLH